MIHGIAINPDFSHDRVYVYVLTNTINGKKYVGISYNPEKRCGSHIKGSYRIGTAIRKHGWDNFHKEIIAVSDRTGALLIEKETCEKLNTLHPNGYNLCAGGKGQIRIGFSDQTRKKLSCSLKGKIKTPEHLENIGKAQRGKTLSEEHKAALRKSRANQVITEESNKKRSITLTGRVKTQEHRDNLSKSHKGKNWTDERRKAKSDAMRGTKWSPERRAAFELRKAERLKNNS